MIDVDGTSMCVTRVLAQTQTKELDIDIEDPHHQTEGLGPVPTLLKFMTTSAYQDTMLGILILFVDM